MLNIRSETNIRIRDGSANPQLLLRGNIKSLSYLDCCFLQDVS